MFLCTFLGFPGGSDGKESTCKAGDLSSILGLERSLEKGMATSLQYSCLANPHGQRSLVGYDNVASDTEDDLRVGTASGTQRNFKFGMYTGLTSGKESPGLLVRNAFH